MYSNRRWHEYASKVQSRRAENHTRQLLCDCLKDCKLCDGPKAKEAKFHICGSSLRDEVEQEWAPVDEEL